MKYDDAGWHYDSTPEGDEESRWNRAAAHIAIYLRCCYSHGWVGELHLQSNKARLAARQVIASNITSTEFLITYCDGKLTPEDLNEEGNAFTAYYYAKKYPADVEPYIKGDLFTVTEECYDYPRLKIRFDQRYAEWIAKGRPAEDKPRWKIW